MTTFNSELTNIINTINKLCPTEIEMDSNITPEEETSLKEILRLSKENIEIKKADKSNTLVIMDKEI